LDDFKAAFQLRQFFEIASFRDFCNGLPAICDFRNAGGKRIHYRLLLGGFAISTAYKWPLSTSIIAILVAMIAGMVVLPAL